MFTAKQKSLLETKKESTTVNSTMDFSLNGFIRKSMQNSLMTRSLGNRALKLTSSGSAFVDDFANASNYKVQRSFDNIVKTVKNQWAKNPRLTISMIFYLRMITRTVQFSNGKKTVETQRGQGLKHESIFRMMWLAINQPDFFWKNISLYIAIGSWKDIIVMLSYDLQYNGWNDKKLDWDKMGKLILAGLENPSTSELVKKYLPQIKANASCKTLESQADNIIAKWICSLLFGAGKSASNYKQYRLYKSKGTAHKWQQLISRGQHSLIDFDSVHGRALSQMVSGKYLKNQGLEIKYSNWIAEKPTAKFTGYPYELTSILGTSNTMASKHLSPYQVDTVNAQFMQLVEVAKSGMDDLSNGFIGVLDSSGSMFSRVPGTAVSAYSVAKTMTLFLSYLLKGDFENYYLEFSDETIMKRWNGKTPVEKLCNDNSSIIGSTNFISIANHFTSILKKGVDEFQFPNGIVCFSDGCFNSTYTNKSNFKELKNKLVKGGFSKQYVDNFKVMLWDIPNNHYGKSQTAFEDFADTPNLFHISGLDPAALAFLVGSKQLENIPKNSDELMQVALSQEVMTMIEL